VGARDLPATGQVQRRIYGHERRGGCPSRGPLGRASLI
jgi:hypothetical protein